VSWQPSAEWLSLNEIQFRQGVLTLMISVSFSADNRQIVSASRDRSIKLWNTLGECKFNIVDDGHTEW